MCDRGHPTCIILRSCMLCHQFTGFYSAGLCYRITVVYQVAEWIVSGLHCHAPHPALNDLAARKIRSLLRRNLCLYHRTSTKMQRSRLGRMRYLGSIIGFFFSLSIIGAGSGILCHSVIANLCTCLIRSNQCSVSHSQVRAFYSKITKIGSGYR